MRASDFEYHLPPELIAQDPLPDRAASRLLVLERASGGIRHARFPDIVDLVAAEDVLVLNVSRVIPARLHGKRDTGRVAELLLVRELPDGTWLALGHPGGKLKPRRRLTVGDDSAVEIVEPLGGGLRRVRFVGALDARGTLAKYGERSEEHTYELQSRLHLVCRLLLEKKKKTTKTRREEDKMTT